MRTLLLKTWRDLLARKGQFIALMLLVAIGITSYVAFISSYRDLKASADRATEELRFATFSTSVISAPEAVLRRIRAIPGVQRPRAVSSSTRGWTWARTTRRRHASWAFQRVARAT